MNRQKVYRLAIAAVLLAGLAACTGPLTREETSAPDMFETKRLADEAYQKGDMVESERLYGSLVKDLPEEAEHWFRLANVYYRTLRPDAAVSAYREAVIRDPAYGKAWYNMGVVQLRQAVNSLRQMELYTGTEDPMYKKGRHLLQGIVDLTEGDGPEQ